MQRRTLDDLLARNNGIAPGFGLLRHALATLILVHHAYVLTLSKFNVGYAKGNIAANLAELTARQAVIELVRPFLFSLVGSFFILSGFLVAGSALRTRSVRTFLGFRVLRIVPALMAEVILSALILGPLVTSFAYGAYFRDPAFYAYFLNIVGIVHYALPGVFLTNHEPGLVNGNLWTLPAEFYCYAFMATLMASGVLFKRSLGLAAIATAYALTIAWMWHQGIDIRAGTTHFSSTFIVLLFYVGVAIYLAREYIVLDRRLCASAVALYYLLMLFNISDAAAGLCLAYVTIYIGSLRFTRFDGWVGSDYSYGIYLYGYPLTQAWVYVLYDRLLPYGSAVLWATIVALGLGSTLIMAKLSWLAIEKPALRLKRFLVPRRQGRALSEPVLGAAKVTSS